MTAVYLTGKKIPTLQSKHDPSDAKYYPFTYRPQVRSNSTVYYVGDVVIPTVFNGLMYECVNPGISASAEPVMSTKLNSKTTDNSVIWFTKPYEALLEPGDSVTASAFSVSEGVSLTDESTPGDTTYVKVTITGSISEFILTNTVTVTRSDSKVETFERSIRVEVTEL